MGGFIDMGAGGICATTPLGLPQGWRRAGDLGLGDALGAGVKVLRLRPAAMGQSWVIVPVMGLGNRHPLVIAGDQPVVLRAPHLSALTGERAVMVPAASLLGWRGVARAAAPKIGVQLTLSRAHLARAGFGAQIGLSGVHGSQSLPPYPSLSEASARQVVACLIAFDAGFALRQRPGHATAIAGKLPL